jgi:hypothetical protein
MDVNWQTWAAIAVVALAAWLLVRRGLAAWRGDGRGTCSGCSSCSSAGERKLPLVEIGDLNPVGGVSDGDSGSIIVTDSSNEA